MDKALEMPVCCQTIMIILMLVSTKIKKEITKIIAQIHKSNVCLLALEASLMTNLKKINFTAVEEVCL